MNKIKTIISIAITALTLGTSFTATAAEKIKPRISTAPKIVNNTPKELPFAEIQIKLMEEKYNIATFKKEWYANQLKEVIKTIPTVVSPKDTVLYEYSLIYEHPPLGSIIPMDYLVKDSAAYTLLKRGLPKRTMSLDEFSEIFGEPIYQLPFEDIGCYRINMKRSDEGLAGLTWQRRYIYADIDKYGRPVEFWVNACDGIIESVSDVYLWNK